MPPSPNSRGRSPGCCSKWIIRIPSFALLIGFIWLRRKKGITNFDTGGHEEEHNSKTIVNSIDTKNKKLGNNSRGRKATEDSLIINTSNHSESLPIESQKILLEKKKKESNNNSNNSPSGVSTNSSSSSLGKSAPIDIAPNTRSPPKRVSGQDINGEVFKLKANHSAIEESFSDTESESPTPIDSPQYRNRFNISFRQSKVEPIVVVKGTMSAKVSPENSFRELKFSECDNNEIHDEEQQEIVTTTGDITSENIKDPNSAVDSGCVIHEDDASRESPNCNEPAASPPLSVCSLHSGDSGQGSSPPQSVGAPTLTYDFAVPFNLIGTVIGRRGVFVNTIKEKTGANVLVTAELCLSKAKKCTIEGTQAEIDAALRMIRQKFPRNKFPYLTLNRLYLSPVNKIIPTFDVSTLHLKLIEGINNDVSVSSIVNGGHLFLQQPLHPTFPSLNKLQHTMNQSYNMTEAPALPEIIDNAICTVRVSDNWYRVQIVNHNPETKSCLVKYLDFGGYVTVDSTDLRQIHADYMSVPFQAMECVLSNVRPSNGEEEWSQAAADTIQSFTQGKIVQAQVAGYTAEDLPEVFLFVLITKDNVIFINRELVARGLADWIEV